MANKKTKKHDDNALTDAARTIGTALGTLTSSISATADEFTAKAKQLHMPTAKEAQSAVRRLLSGKSPVAKAKKKSPAAAPKKKVVKKTAPKKKKK